MCKVMHREAVVYNVAEQYVSPKNLNTGCDEATSTKSIFVIVLPVRPSLGGSKGCYEAHLQGRLVARSRTPFLDAARKLLAEGFSPNTVIAMRRAGSDTDCMTATLGAAAKLTVVEHNDTRFTKWKPVPRSAVSPLMRR